MIDLNQFPMHKKPYADNTLRCMPRKELIAYIRDIEHNYETLFWFYQNAVNANLEKFKDFERVVRCKDCKYSSPNQVYGCRIHSFADDLDKRMYAYDFCSMAERKEE